MEFLDRSAYRMYSDFRLIDAAKYSPNAELAIVLAERLEEVQADFDLRHAELIDKIEDLDRQIRNLTEDLRIAEGA